MVDSKQGRGGGVVSGEVTEVPLAFPLRAVGATEGFCAAGIRPELCFTGLILAAVLR